MRINMKLQDFLYKMLNEEISTETSIINFKKELELKDAVSILNTFCKNAVKQFVDNNVLIRGIYVDKTIFYNPKRDTKRKPKDSLVSIDNFIEIFRTSEFVPNCEDIPSRQYSIFCFKGANDVTTSYGRYKYYVFPKDNCKLFQSDHVRDFFESYVYQSILEYLTFELKPNDPGLYKVLLQDNISQQEKFMIIDRLKKDAAKNHLEDKNYAKEALKNCTYYFTEGVNKTIESMDNKHGKSEVVIEGDCYLIKNNDIKTYDIIKRMLTGENNETS